VGNKGESEPGFQLSVYLRNNSVKNLQRGKGPAWEESFLNSVQPHKALTHTREGRLWKTLGRERRGGGEPLPLTGGIKREEEG